MDQQRATASIAASKLRYVQYDSSKEAEYLSAIRQLISKDLSEPYSIYVYRYFLYQWGNLCFLVSGVTALISLFKETYFHSSTSILHHFKNGRRDTERGKTMAFPSRPWTTTTRS